MSTTTDTAEARAARIEEIKALEMVIESHPALEGQSHSNVLTALLSVYLRMAIAHSCCTESCLIQTTKAVFILGQKAASTTPQGAPIH